MSQTLIFRVCVQDRRTAGEREREVDGTHSSWEKLNHPNGTDNKNEQKPFYTHFSVPVTIRQHNIVPSYSSE